MMTTIEALCDGSVFLPTEPIELKPNTRVRLLVETTPPEQETLTSFLRTACSLELSIAARRHHEA